MSNISSDKAVIITIGNEILSGKTVNTNAAFIAQELEKLGLRIERAIAVGDVKTDIQWAVKEACGAASVIVCTGGLGPTRDDISKRAVAEYFGKPIHVDRKQLKIVRGKFRSFGYKKMPESNITQAEVPEGAVVFPNPRGTAPGLLIVDKGIHLFMLPGVPGEMKGLMTEQVIPYVRDRLESQEIIISRMIRTTGVGESRLAELLHPVLGDLDDPEIAFLPDPLGVDLRLTTRGTNEKELRKKIQHIEEAIVRIVPEFLYGHDDDTLESVVGNLFKKHNLTIAVAESCTGGLVGDRITEVSSSSLYFDRAVVTYSNASKIDLLDVDAATLKNKGAVSEDVVRQMAENIRKKSGCDIGVSTTGIAGPAGATPEKPVGLVFIGLADSYGTIAKKLQLRGDRTRIKRQTAQALLNFIRLRFNDTNFYSN